MLLLRAILGVFQNNPQDEVAEQYRRETVQPPLIPNTSSASELNEAIKPIVKDPLKNDQ